MPSKYGNKSFYDSAKWKKVSTAYMSSKNYICERCGKPAQICHHKIWLNETNVLDPMIALNPENLEALCIDCHNAEHGLKHDVAIFDKNGNIADIKESSATKDYQRDRAQIDDVIAKAKALSVVSSKRPPTDATERR